MFKELLKEEYLEVYLDYFQKEKKGFRMTRLIYGFVLFFIVVLGLLIMNQQLWLLISPLAFYVGYKAPYYSLMGSKKQDELRVSFLFPQFLQSFMGLIASSGNVYQTLKGSLSYTNDPLRKELQKLVDRIEKDNTRDAYMEFAEFVGTNEAYTIMDMIYQFSEFGVKKDTLQELQAYIQGLDENKTEELIGQKLSKAEKYGYVSVFISLFLIVGYAGAIFMYYMDDVLDALKVIS